MTVSTLTNKVTYIGNGSTTEFAVPFKVLDVDHLVVKRLVAATGDLSYTYLGTDYSYSGIGNDSGTLTLEGAALTSTYELVIERIVPYTQELDIVNAGGFYPETVEDQLDRTTMQVQQIAAQSDDIATRALMVPEGETAPDYADFAETFRGDPGGNVESAGLFISLALGLTTIPAGTTRVVTSGWQFHGIGSAEYVEDEDLDETYVDDNPDTSFLAADDRVFILMSDRITPWMMGAEGPNDLDDWTFGADTDNVLPVDNAPALKTFFDYVAASRRKLNVDFAGIWGVTDHDEDGFGVAINQPRYAGHNFICGTFIALGPMTDVVRATALRTSRFTGTWAIQGCPANRESPILYEDRLADNCITFVNCSTTEIDEIRVSGAKIWGAQDHTSGNNIMLKIGMLFAESCGSLKAFDGYRVTADFTSRTDTGGSAGHNQLSELGGIADTSEFIVNSPVYITETDTTHWVRAKTSNSISVYPWPPHGTTAGEVISMHGGAVAFKNNDSTGVEIDRLDAFHCGAAMWSGGLYGIMVNNYQAQICSIGILLGQNVSGTVSTNRATHIKRVHSEANDLDLVVVTTGSQFQIDEVSAWGSDSDPSLFTRTVAMAPRFNAGTLGGILSYGSGLRGSFQYQGRRYFSSGNYTQNRNDNADTLTNRADGRILFYIANTFTINLNWDQPICDTWNNAGAVQVGILGTGANRQPTGTITVQPTAAQAALGYTVNGGATVSITGLTERANIVAMLQAGTTNWLVAW